MITEDTFRRLLLIFALVEFFANGFLKALNYKQCRTTYF